MDREDGKMSDGTTALVMIVVALGVLIVMSGLMHSIVPNSSMGKILSFDGQPLRGQPSTLWAQRTVRPRVGADEGGFQVTEAIRSACALDTRVMSTTHGAGMLDGMRTESSVQLVHMHWISQGPTSNEADCRGDDGFEIPYQDMMHLAAASGGWIVDGQHSWMGGENINAGVPITGVVP